MLSPSLDEFLKLTKKGNLIPVYKEVPGDTDTPVSTYYKIAEQTKYSFLLESVEGEEKIARYSFLSRNPELVICSKDNKVEITRLNNGKKSSTTKKITDTPLSFIREIISRYKFVAIPGLPRFCGGLVGYLGYDMVRFFEHLPNKPKDDLKLPDMLLVLAKEIIIFDHRNHQLKLVRCIEITEKMSKNQITAAYRQAERELDKLVAEITKPLTMKGSQKPLPASKLKISSNCTQQTFKRVVEKAKRYILAGDIIQVVLSQRFAINLKTSPFNIYRRLRTLNPSPYMYYLNFDGLQIIGSSPELLLRCEDGLVETRPIAGTRKRGKDESEDKILMADLLNDPKEKAEHIMLVDLGRNDLGRVCQRGTVQVNQFMDIERYSHVMHIVSNVRGKLKEGKDALDALQAAFPAGTLSGAPKIRAMEIIDELENVSRGPYGGCIGYFSFSGNLDSCITIRTVVVTNGKAYVQAGAGIVADSVPQTEFQETVNKATAQILAIEQAHRQ